MSTKNNPGPNSCYEKAEPDEPMFVLLGRDPLANLLVALWADARARIGEEPAKIEEAMKVAEDMMRWSLGKRGPTAVRVAVEAIHASVLQYVKEMNEAGAP